MGVVFILPLSIFLRSMSRQRGRIWGVFLPIYKGFFGLFRHEKIFPRVNVPPTRKALKRAYIGQDYGSSIHFTAPIEKFTKIWYNICVKALRGKSFGFAFVRLRVPHILTASQKCPCEQAFLLHGIMIKRTTNRRRSNVPHPL